VCTSRARFPTLASVRDFSHALARDAGRLLPLSLPPTPVAFHLVDSIVGNKCIINAATGATGATSEINCRSSPREVGRSGERVGEEEGRGREGTGREGTGREGSGAAVVVPRLSYAMSALVRFVSVSALLFGDPALSGSIATCGSSKIGISSRRPWILKRGGGRGGAGSPTAKCSPALFARARTN